MQAQFSATVIDHFQNPRHVGILPPPSAEGTASRGAAGPIIRLYVELEDDRLARVSFLTQGCVAAIAAASWVAMSMTGRTRQEARALTPSAELEGLGGLPSSRRFCGNLVVQALNLALDAAEKQQKGEPS